MRLILKKKWISFAFIALIAAIVSVVFFLKSSQPTLIYPDRKSGKRTGDAGVISASGIRYSLELLKAHAEISNVPGYQMAVYHRDSLVLSTAIGYSDLTTYEPLTPRHLMRIGSVSKPLTAFAAMKLVEEGKLELDNEINKYVDFPEKEWSITVRDLLCHQGGIRHYTGKSDVFRVEHYDDVTSALAIFRNDPLMFEPGTQFGYSSFGYNLLSAVIEDAAGMPFLEYMRKTFRKIGLKDILADQKDSLSYKRSNFFIKSKGGFVEAPFEDLSYKWASGGFLSNANTLAKFGSLLLNREVLKNELTKKMFSDQNLNDGTKTGYGLGWIVGNDLKDRKVYYHNGNLRSGRAFLVLYPDYNLSFAVTANTGTGIYLNEREVFGMIDALFFTKGKKELLEAAMPLEGVHSFKTVSLKNEEVRGIIQLSIADGEVKG